MAARELDKEAQELLKPRRRTGARDPEATRRLILQAAIAEFADLGFGGARIEGISQRSGFNLRMIYYYFGSKEAMYVAALEQVYSELVTAEQALNLQDEDPRDGMRRVISFTWHYFNDHPEFVRLVNTENMLGARFARSSTRISNNASPQLKVLQDLLSRGIAAGYFRRDAGVFETHLTINSLCYFHVSNRATMSNYLGRDMTSQASHDLWLSHVTQVVMDHLTAKSSSSRQER